MKLLPVLLLVSVAGTVAAQPPGDAVSVDPAHHRVILDNDHVRVFEVVASMGATSPMHSHIGTVIVSLGRARLHQTMPDGSRSVFDLHPGQVLWVSDFAHAWELVAGEGHVIGVEVKAAQRGETAQVPPIPASDAVARDPLHHVVVFENEHTRVFQALAGPGARSPMHTHEPFVLISHGRSRVRLDTPGGQVVVDLTPGFVLWLENERHGWEILGGRTEVTGVEIKAARAAP